MNWYKHIYPSSMNIHSGQEVHYPQVGKDHVP